MKKFLLHILTLLSGTVLAQLANLLLIPILSRLYMAEATGISGEFIAVVLTLSVGINGGFEAAIMLPKSEKEAVNLTQLSWVAASFFSIILLLVALLVGEFWLPTSKFSALYGWHLLIPLSLWIEGSCQAFRYWLNRQKGYHYLSIGKTLNVLIRNSLSILVGYYYPHFSMLILAFLVGQLANFIPILVGVYRLKSFSFDLQFSTLKNLLTQYQDFTKFGLISSWLNQASKQLPVFIIPLFFTAKIEGWYIHADKVLMIPMLVAVTIGEVFYQQAAAAYQISKEELWKITKKTTFMLATLAIAPLVITILGGQTLFGWVFGEEYAMSGEYARWLSPMMFFTFLASPLSFLIDIKRKLNVFLFYNIFAFLLKIIVLYPVCQSSNIIYALQLYSLVSCLLLIYQVFYLLKIAYPKA